jgi:hypothetical protein
MELTNTALSWAGTRAQSVHAADSAGGLRSSERRPARPGQRVLAARRIAAQAEQRDKLERLDLPDLDGRSGLRLLPRLQPLHAPKPLLQICILRHRRLRGHRAAQRGYRATMAAQRVHEIE